MDDSEKMTLTATDTAPHTALPSYQFDQQYLRAAAAGNLFISAKTSTAIPARNLVVRDALIEASLDSAVRSIDYVESAWVASASVKLDAVIIVRDDGRYVLDVIESRPLRDLDAEGLVQIALRDLGLTPLSITRAVIRREPRFTNSKLVWSYRLCPVGITLRMKVLGILGDDGPMSLVRLLASIRSDRDPTAAIMALACSDLIELDLVTQPLGPQTIARSRS
jgi:hypothetical protein